jgi:hypothetical protein
MGLSPQGQIESTAYGPVGCRGEGYAGERFRRLLERQQMFALNTLGPWQPTFCPPRGWTAHPTRIDFMAAPAASVEVTRHCHASSRIGKALHIIPDPAPRDYRPVVFRFDDVLDFPAAAQGPRWDHEGRRCVDVGRGPGRFCAGGRAENPGQLRQLVKISIGTHPGSSLGVLCARCLRGCPKALRPCVCGPRAKLFEGEASEAAVAETDVENLGGWSRTRRGRNSSKSPRPCGWSRERLGGS